jgi:hypothetical protein
MTVLITLTTAGTDTGPFNLYSNVDGFITPFATGVSRSALLAGYSATTVPNGTTTIRVMSTGTCTNYIDISVTTTTTTSTSSTTSTTTTGVPTTTSTTTTSAPGNNFFVVNGGTIGSITDVTESGLQFYTINVGSYPVGASQTLEGTHAGLSSATIDVAITTTGNGCLTLYINTVQQAQQNVTVSGTYNFAGVTFTSGDIVEIELIDGTC